METKIKELIAIGASVTANCVPCLRVHLQQARKAGATPDEIQKAVGVGRMVRKGAAGKWDDEANALWRGEHDGEQEGNPPSCAEP